MTVFPKKPKNFAGSNIEDREQDGIDKHRIDKHRIDKQGLGKAILTQHLPPLLRNHEAIILEGVCSLAGAQNKLS